jgi:hypothetical protein
MSSKIKTLRAAILAVLGSAAGSGLLAADAAAKVVAPRNEDELGTPLLLAPPVADSSELLAHRSHQSHRSHRSHSSGGHSGGSSWGGSSSGRSGGSSSGSSGSGWEKKAPPPKPAKVSLQALPGGTIFVDGERVGHDETKTLKLKAGTYQVKVENQFLGDHEIELTLTAGQSGTVKIEW